MEIKIARYQYNIAPSLAISISYCTIIGNFNIIFLHPLWLPVGFLIKKNSLVASYQNFLLIGSIPYGNVHYLFEFFFFFFFLGFFFFFHFYFFIIISSRIFIYHQVILPAYQRSHFVFWCEFQMRFPPFWFGWKEILCFFILISIC